MHACQLSPGQAVSWPSLPVGMSYIHGQHQAGMAPAEARWISSCSTGLSRLAAAPAGGAQQAAPACQLSPGQAVSWTALPVGMSYIHGQHQAGLAPAESRWISSSSTGSPWVVAALASGAQQAVPGGGLRGGRWGAFLHATLHGA
jgi:hypothetical protein